MRSSASDSGLPAREVAGAQGLQKGELFPLVTSCSRRCFLCCPQVLVLRNSIPPCKVRGALVPVLGQPTSTPAARPGWTSAREPSPLSWRVPLPLPHQPQGIHLPGHVTPTCLFALFLRLLLTDQTRADPDCQVQHGAAQRCWHSVLLCLMVPALKPVHTEGRGCSPVKETCVCSE